MDEAVKISQLSVFLENKSGGLANIAANLGEFGINIRAMSLQDNKNFGILRLVVNDTVKAQQILKELGFAVRLSEVVAVEIPDKPGELGKLLRIIENKGFNVEYMYAFVQGNQDRAVLMFRFDDTDKAIDAIAAAGITLLLNSEVSRL